MDSLRAETYQMSVVEREVREGILEAPEAKGTALAFLRKIGNINMADNKHGKDVFEYKLLTYLIGFIFEH